jgi:aquaporin rerated protein, other eukaryote
MQRPPCWADSTINHLTDIIAALGEFVGTTMFLFFAFSGTAVATVAPGDGSTGFNISVQTYIALCFGFSLMVNVWIFYRISGGLFNPAVSTLDAPWIHPS